MVKVNDKHLSQEIRKKSSKLNTNKGGKIIKIEADINEYFLMCDF